MAQALKAAVGAGTGGDGGGALGDDELPPGWKKTYNEVMGCNCYLNEKGEMVMDPAAIPAGNSHCSKSNMGEESKGSKETKEAQDEECKGSKELKAAQDIGSDLCQFLNELEISEVDKVVKALGDLAIMTKSDLLAASSKEDRTELLDGIRDSGVRLGDRIKLSRSLEQIDSGNDDIAKDTALPVSGQQNVPNDIRLLQPHEHSAAATHTTIPANNNSDLEPPVKNAGVSSLIGTWQYSERGIYDIVQTVDGCLLFEQRITAQQVLCGQLHWFSPWWKGKVSCDGVQRGEIRVRHIQQRDVVVSNFKAAGSKEFGGDNLAKKTEKQPDLPCAIDTAGTRGSPDSNSMEEHQESTPKKEEAPNAFKIHERLQKYSQKDKALSGKESKMTPTASDFVADSKESLELQRMLYEVKPGWSIDEVSNAMQKLKVASVTSIPGLEAALARDGGDELNNSIRAKGLKVFSRDTLNRFRAHTDNLRNQRRWRNQLETRRQKDDEDFERALAEIQQAHTDNENIPRMDTPAEFTKMDDIIAKMETPSDLAQNPQDSNTNLSSACLHEAEDILG